MSNTKISKFLQHLRIDKNITAKTMANELDVSTAFLNAVENETKKPPSTMVTKIYRQYELDAEQAKTFTDAVADATKKLELMLEDTCEPKKAIAVEFAAAFNSDGLTDEQIEEIRKIIRKER